MQTELFEKFEAQGWERLANGCYGTVYSKLGSDWIVKRAHNDGTRTYLEWVMLMTRRGKRMRGMPELDFIVAVASDQYMVGMKRYQSLANKLKDVYGFERNPTYEVHLDPKCPKYLSRLVDAFKHDCPAVSANDVHHGNVMLDSRTKDFILTDPSSSSYRPVGSTYNAWTADGSLSPNEFDVAKFELAVQVEAQ